MSRLMRVAPDRIPFRDAYPFVTLADDNQIQYWRLPARAQTAYGRRFQLWSDLADESVASLLAMPQAGVVTVRAMLDEMEEQQREQWAPHSDLRFLAPVDWSAPSGSPVPLKPPIRVFPLDSARREIEVLHRWASAHGADSPVTFGQVLSLPDQSLPPDVQEARASLLQIKLSTGLTESAPDFVRNMMGQLDERVLHILTERRWQPNAPTLADLGDQLGLTRERVRQLQARGHEDLVRLLAKHDEVRWLVFEVGRCLGPWLPAGAARDSLAALGLSMDSSEGRLVLDLAGPYVGDGSEWLVREHDEISQTAPLALLAAVDSNPSVTRGDLVATLVELGLRGDAAEAILASETRLRQFGTRWVRWTGNAVDKAEIVLRLSGEPLTSDEVTDRIGEGHSKGTVQNGMSVDDRFVRASRRTWGLREWGIEEYSGIVEEILERIERDGGSSDVRALTNEVTTTFGVAENSIQLYLGTLAFIVNDGRVRRRTESDPWPIETRLALARGAYGTEDGLRLRVNTTKDVLRGSGQTIHPAVANALGVRPGSRREFLDDSGEVVQVGWRAWSTTGPDLGSTRSLAVQASATEGDEIVLVFNVHDSTVRAERVTESLTGTPRLTALAALDPGEDIEAQLARSIGCERGEVRSTLRNRGDGAVADLLSSRVDERLEAAIETLLGELG